MIIADDQSFSREVLMERGAILVEFFTPTCQPCRQMEPWLQMLEFELKGRLKVVKVDSTRSPKISQFYGVRMAPTLIIFKNGEPMQVIQGKPPSPQRLYEFVGPYL